MSADFVFITYANNTLLRWFLAAGMALLCALVLRLAKGLIVRYVGRLADTTRTWADNVVVKTVAATRWYLYLAIGLYAGATLVELSDRVASVLAGAVAVTVLMQTGIWAQVLTAAVVGNWVAGRGGNQSATVGAGVTFVARLVIWSGVALLALANLGVDVTAVVAGLGVGGVAVALAVQGILGDLFASLSMYFDRPFDIGDFIIVDDFMGTVDKIGLRTTRVRSLGGEQIVFANGDLAKSRVRNYARMVQRRVVFSFGIEYNLPADKLEQAALIARETIGETPDVRLDRVHFKAFGAYSLDFEAVYYVLSPDYTLYMERQHAINMSLYRRFEAAGIPFAFPTQTVHLKTDPEAGPARP